MFTIPRSESLNFSGPDASAPLSESMPDAHGWGPYFKAIFFTIARAECDNEIVSTNQDANITARNTNAKTEVSTDNRTNLISTHEEDIQNPNISERQTTDHPNHSRHSFASLHIHPQFHTHTPLISLKPLPNPLITPTRKAS